MTSSASSTSVVQEDLTLTTDTRTPSPSIPSRHPRLVSVDDPELRAKFWQRVAWGTEADCWPWTGKVDRNGYGMLRHKGREYRANRLALAMAGQPLPAGLHACHHCDNPSCVNPQHMYAGTHQENMNDMKRRGRAGRAKLTPEQVSEIRARHEAGESQLRLAREFGMAPSTINSLVHRQHWQQVGPVNAE